MSRYYKNLFGIFLELKKFLILAVFAPINLVPSELRAKKKSVSFFKFPSLQWNSCLLFIVYLYSQKAAFGPWFVPTIALCLPEGGEEDVGEAQGEREEQEEVPADGQGFPSSSTGGGGGPAALPDGTGDGGTKEAAEERDPVPGGHARRHLLRGAAAGEEKNR